jgi:hypothetical protein
MRFKHLIVAVPLLVALSGCQEEALTAKEALQALEEVALSSQALTSTSGTVEIGTNFTIGAAIEAAAEELEDFILTQLPCAEITLVGAVLTIEYGVYPEEDCVWYGQTYTGSHSIEIVSASQGNLVVHHEWTELANDKVEVSGTADVTWSSAEGSRNVVHELTWTRLSDGFEVVGSGDRTQAALNSNILEGMTIEGTRQWTSERGDWDLDIDGVEIRWIDPVPQAGVYDLTTPFKGKSGDRKSASLTFERVDEDTISVTVASGDKSFSFHVSKLGFITEADEE